jgi:murein DD-endopeptidase MepM/ murein hydrolase activator NlpD
LTDLLRWGSAGFPERQSLREQLGREQLGREQLGGRLAVALGDRRAAAVLGAAAVIGLGAAAILGVAYINHERLAATQAAAILHQERANADLQDALAQLKDKVAATDQTLSLAQRQIAALSEETKRQLAASAQAASSKTDRIAQLAQALDEAQRQLHLSEAQRVTLMARLDMAETNRVSSRQQAREQAPAAIDQWQRKVQQLTADRDRAASERDQLRARIGELEQKLSVPQSWQSRRPPIAPVQPAPAAAPPPPPARQAAAAAAVIVPGRTEPNLATAQPAPALRAEQRPAATIAVAATQPPPAFPTNQSLPQTPLRRQGAGVRGLKAPGNSIGAGLPAVAVAVPADGRLGQFERVLASAGVDVKRLFAEFGVGSGLGGPFVPMPRGGLPDSHFSAAKLAALPGLIKSLPLSLPMSSYRETSPFGERRDPFNGRAAFHPGIDLAAPYGTPVYATAAGVVTFAGWSGGYGKIVEIDHGHGIVTRYGHLERPTVLVGERVAAGTQIGYEGSTGRSTGPHVIYEIDVNGEPQDPEKFLGLARLVPVSAAAR